MNKMQEKFQITPRPQNDEKDNEWSEFVDNRVVTWVKDRNEAIPYSPDRLVDLPSSAPADMRMSYNNEMPPGYHIHKQHGYDNGYVGFKKKIYLAGTQDITDNPTNQDLINGFVKSEMSPVEDMYTEEHKDDFYDSVVLETAEGTVEGFVERANYLDRE